MYTFNSRIRYSEVDKNARLTLESLIDYFQDCSTFQTQDGPADMKYLREKGLVWVLVSWQIEVMRYPKLCEEVTIGTIPYEINGYFGIRNFFMETGDGERLAVANSVWTLLDIENGRPRRVTQEIADAYPIEEKLDMDYKTRKIVVPDDAEKIDAEEILIRRHHLDTNNHVNNGQYIRIAMDSLPDKDRIVYSMRSEYRKQALLGDILYPNVYKVKDGDKRQFVVDLKDADGKSVCIVELLTSLQK
jgi:acyl-ACP thioesterase